jgi:hypothetical protein
LGETYYSFTIIDVWVAIGRKHIWRIQSRNVVPLEFHAVVGHLRREREATIVPEIKREDKSGGDSEMDRGRQMQIVRKKKQKGIDKGRQRQKEETREGERERERNREKW